MQPEWVIEDLLSVQTGIAEGHKSRPAGSGSGGYAAGNMTAAEIASANGLPPPSGGWGTLLSDQEE